MVEVCEARGQKELEGRRWSRCFYYPSVFLPGRNGLVSSMRTMQPYHYGTVDLKVYPHNDVLVL